MATMNRIVQHRQATQNIDNVSIAYFTMELCFESDETVALRKIVLFLCYLLQNTDSQEIEYFRAWLLTDFPLTTRFLTSGRHPITRTESIRCVKDGPRPILVLPKGFDHEVDALRKRSGGNKATLNKAVDILIRLKS